MRIENDHYPTPLWMLDCLVDVVDIRGTILDPGAGSRNNILQYFQNNSCLTISNDLYFENYDFNLDATKEESWLNFGDFDWVVMNPPYTQPDVMEFLKHAIKYSKVGVAALLRVTVDEMVMKDQSRCTFWQKNPYRTTIKMPRYCFSNSSKTGKPSVDSAYTQWFVWDKRITVRYRYDPVYYYPHSEIPRFQRSHVA
jgi:hypothetical protein